jgi:hypothetical protein
MKTSHLQTHDGSIRCVNCGSEFEASKFVLADPERVVGLKESIASAHVCGRIVERSTPRGSVRVMVMASAGSLDRYYENAMRRAMSA